jgi:hypothetical protein
MKFEEALEAIRAGLCVRRKSWIQPNLFLQKINKHPESPNLPERLVHTIDGVQIDNDDYNSKRLLQDILADDWEIKETEPAVSVDPHQFDLILKGKMTFLPVIDSRDPRQFSIDEVVRVLAENQAHKELRIKISHINHISIKGTVIKILSFRQMEEV